MKKIIVGFLLLVFATAIRAQKQFVVDANAEMRTIGGSFNAIKVSGSIDIYLSQSDEEAIAISASEEKFKAGIKTVVENNTLKIYFDGDKTWSLKNKKMIAYVSFKGLQRIEASGASDIIVAGSIDVPSLQMDLSGASDFKGAVSVTSLILNLSGASDIRISGKATTLFIESSGASDVKGYELSADMCTAKASGASDINITVNNELNAHASGASNIYYRGSGVIKEIHSNGSSNVAKKG